MSNQYLKLRRSSTPGKIPTTSSLDFGEIALNTYDGLVFMKKSGSNGEEIIPIGASSIDTSSFVTTSSFNNFTASYNTGSFSGSLQGTASYALSGGSPGGLDTQIQYNNNNAFAGDAAFTYNYTSQSLQLGNEATASGQYSFARGSSSLASGLGSHAEGEITRTYGFYSHAEGQNTVASGSYSHAEGNGTETIGEGAHAEGKNSIAYDDYSHAEGEQTEARGYASHTEGYKTVTSTEYAHAEGEYTLASGYAAHAEGHYTTASGDYSHAEGDITIASGYASRAAGFLTLASEEGAYAEGRETTALGSYSHAEGYKTIAQGGFSHAEGAFTYAKEDNSHAEGTYTLASGNSSHTEGILTTASGDYSHAEGYSTIASGSYSHAGGYYTIASGSGQTVIGQYNKHNNTASLFVVGAGTADNDRKDAFTIESSGLGIFTNGLTVTGSLTVSGSNTFTNIGPAIFSGSVTSTGGFTGSLQGTASFATTASYVIGGGLTINTTPISSGIEGGILFQSASILRQNSNLYWDNVNSLLGIGTTSPTAKLHLPAGTAAANTSPLKFTQGTLLSIAEAGAVEYNGSDFYTTNASSRKIIYQGTYSTAPNYFTGYHKNGSAFTTGGNNILMGWTAGYSMREGSNNIGLGNGALYAVDAGNNNIAIGGETLIGSYFNSNNVAIGGFALRNLSVANGLGNSVAIGHKAGYGITTGPRNIFIGYQAGLNVTSGAQNLIIGYDINAPSATASNQLSIGNLIFGTNVDGTGSFISTGNIGIGTSSPAYKLDVSGSGNFTNGLTVTGSVVATSFTGSLQGTASYSTTASYASSTLLITGSTAIFPALPNASSGSLLYQSGSVLSNSSLLIWDDNTKQLRIKATGKITPALYIENSGQNTAAAYFEPEISIGGVVLSSYATNGQLQVKAPIMVASTTRYTFRPIYNGVAWFDICYDGANAGSIIFGGDGGATYPNYRSTGTTANTIASNNGNLIFTANAGTPGSFNTYTATERMRITPSGSVGIGTSSPSASLDVSGSGRFTNGLTVTGSVNLATGSITITTGSVTMPNRPAFRVTGASSSDITAVTILSGSAVTVDYNQGNYYNNTTGLFTAPIAGLYHVYLNARVGSVNSQMQAIVYKNGNIVQLMWEAPGTSASTHFGVSGIVNLAVNDTLQVTVAVGKINFDGNDSWGAAYIG